MNKNNQYLPDIERILSHRYDNGGDLWSTPDKRLLKGAPFSTLESVLYLLELGVNPGDPIMTAAAGLIFSTWQQDGRFKIYPKGGIYPCQTALAARALCHLGYGSDHRIQTAFRHFLDTQRPDGGWRCNKFSYGRGPETEFSNPHPTLIILDAFRFSGYHNEEPALEKAVDFLLDHWVIKKPIGPCHYGIGTLFMQPEYPFRSYNIFEYVYVPSFYKKAAEDSRFYEALTALKTGVIDGKIVVKRVVSKLSELSFCKKGEPSEPATKRYDEILDNLNSGHSISSLNS